MLLLTQKRRANRDRAQLRDEFKQTLSLITSTARNQVDSVSEAVVAQLGIIEKAFAQLRATNAWEYQAIMTMSGQAPAYDETYDPSPEADALRIADRMSAKDELDESLSAEEADVLGDLYPGL